MVCPPDDVLLLIGQHIWDLPTKRNLTLCSQRFYWLFRPLLYSSLYIGSTYLVFERRFQKISIPLIQNLCRRQDLARLVRHLTCTADGGDGSLDAGFENQHVELDAVLIGGVLDEICETEEEKSRWISHLKASNEEAWTSLLLTRLSRLETIDLSYGDPYFLQQILNKAAKRQRPFHETPPFPFLRAVHISCDTEDNWVDADWAWPFFYFPAVRKVTGTNVHESSRGNPEGLAFDPSDIINPTRPVTEIKIVGTIDSEGMVNWVAACERLETFKLAYGHRDHEYDEYRFNAKSFRQSLLRVKQTLKTLWLCFRTIYQDLRMDRIAYNDGEVEEDDLKEDSPFGSLKEFSVLQDLHIRHANLVRLVNIVPADSDDENSGASLGDLLPGSLEKLHLMDINEDHFTYLVSDLIELISDRDTFVPRFRSLRLDGEHLEEGDEGVEDSLDLLKEVCERAGIHLNIHRGICWSAYELEECSCGQERRFRSSQDEDGSF